MKEFYFITKVQILKASSTLSSVTLLLPLTEIDNSNIQKWSTSILQKREI